MKHSNRAQEIRVGLISILAVAALIGGIVWGKGIGFNVGQRSVLMRFPNAAGITVGTPVTLNGVNQGSVSAVRTFANHVEVVALVEPGTPLSRDASARIEMAEITGGKRVALSAGHSEEPLPDNAVIVGTVSADPAQLVSDVGEIGTDARVAVRRLDTSLAMLNAIITDPAFRRRLDNTLINLEEASGSARAIVVENRAAIERALANVDAAAGDLRRLVGATTPAVDRTLAGAEQATTEIRAAVATTEVALRSADTLLRRLDSLAADIRYGQGAANMLVYDTTFANQLRETIDATRDLVEHTRRNGFNLNIGFGRR